MKQQSMKHIFGLCMPLLACALIVACVSQIRSQKVVEYFLLNAAKIEPQLITAEGSTVTIEYNEIMPLGGNDLKLAVQVKATTTEEERLKYSTSKWALAEKATLVMFYVKEDVVIPPGYAWRKYKMSNGMIEFIITDDEQLDGEQAIMIYLSQHDKRVSNSVTVEGIFQE